MMEQQPFAEERKKREKGTQALEQKKREEAPEPRQNEEEPGNP